MSDTSHGRITVSCPTCGASLGLPDGAVGRRAKCPQCEQRFVVERPESGAEPAADHSTGPSLPDTPFQPATAPPPPRSPVSAMGAYLLGTGLSVLGAFLGAAVWCAIAIVSGYELAWIAWGLGVAAGIGMRLGYRRPGFLAGAMAAVVAVGGILAARAMLVAYYVWPTAGNVVTGGPARNLLQSRLLVAMNEQLLEAADVPAEDEQAAEQAYEMAVEVLGRLSDEQLRARFVRYGRSHEVCGIATADEGEFERNWLAAHRANRRANDEGLHDDDDRRVQYYRQECLRVQQASPAENETAIRELAEWEDRGWLLDPDYVRTALIYTTVRRAWEQDQGYGVDQVVDEARSLSPKEWILRQAQIDHDSLIREWDTRYAAAVREVDALSPEEQVFRARELIEHRKAKLDELVAAIESMPPLEQIFAAEVARFAGSQVYWQLFDATDILFGLLAVASAYAIAARRGES